MQMRMLKSQKQSSSSTLNNNMEGFTMARSKALKQLSLIDDKLETPVVKSADRYIQLVKDASVIKEKKQVQERNLIGLRRRYFMVAT
jgi:hypothetical protein